MLPGESNAVSSIGGEYRKNRRQKSQIEFPENGCGSKTIAIEISGGMKWVRWGQ